MMTEKQVKFMATRLLFAAGYEDWKVTFGNGVDLAGLTRFSKKTLVFSRLHVQAQSDRGMHLIILHEIAHVIAGHAAGHGPDWQMVCESIGGDPKCEWAEQHLAHPEILEARRKFVTVCLECGTELGRTVRKRTFSEDTVHRGCGGSVECRRLTSV